MTPGDRPERLACLIVAHNLGDAVIQSRFFERLVDSGYAERYLVWTRPQAAFLFKSIANCDIICSQFPVGTNKQFGVREMLRFLACAWRVRRLRPTVTIDLIGDARDRWFARLAGSRRHIFPGWAPGHPFRRLIRNPLGSGKPAIVIPASTANVYEAQQLLLASLVVGTRSANGRIAEASPKPRAPVRRVGIHPFASQACKFWPADNWRRLMRLLLQDELIQVTAFGAPGERRELENLMAEFGSRVTIITSSLNEFALHVAKLDVMVGLDSFSVHMAERQGVRSVLINAGNPSTLWAAPGGRTLATSGGCGHYPCFNVPKCEGTPKEYACVRAVTVEAVADAALG